MKSPIPGGLRPGWHLTLAVVVAVWLAGDLRGQAVDAQSDRAASQGRVGEVQEKLGKYMSEIGSRAAPGDQGRTQSLNDFLEQVSAENGAGPWYEAITRLLGKGRRDLADTLKCPGFAWTMNAEVLRALEAAGFGRERSQVIAWLGEGEGYLAERTMELISRDQKYAGYAIELAAMLNSGSEKRRKQAVRTLTAWRPLEPQEAALVFGAASPPELVLVGMKAQTRWGRMSDADFAHVFEHRNADRLLLEAIALLPEDQAELLWMVTTPAYSDLVRREAIGRIGMVNHISATQRQVWRRRLELLAGDIEYQGLSVEWCIKQLGAPRTIEEAAEVLIEGDTPYYQDALQKLKCPQASVYSSLVVDGVMQRPGVNIDMEQLIGWAMDTLRGMEGWAEAERLFDVYPDLPPALRRIVLQEFLTKLPQGKAGRHRLCQLLEECAQAKSVEGRLLLLDVLRCFQKDAVVGPTLPLVVNRLSGRPDDELPKPHDTATVVRALLALVSLAGEGELPATLRAVFETLAAELGPLALELEQKDWNRDDLELVQEVWGVFAAIGWHSEKREAAQLMHRMKAKSPENRARRLAGQAAAGVGLLLLVWLLVVLLYPWLKLAQWVVWQPWVRRLAGLGIAGPLLLRSRVLRDRLWRPFREELVPPGELQTFDEWTFFESLRMHRGGQTVPALASLQSAHGVMVLTGASGTGKSTLLQALAALEKRPVALLRAAECGGGIVAGLQRRLPERLRGDASFLRALLNRESPRLLVDALQEAPQAVQQDIFRELPALPRASVLLATQPAGAAVPEKAEVWELEPLTPAEVRRFLLRQGLVLLEAAAGAGAAREAAFRARVDAYLARLETLPAEAEEAAAHRRMLGNPMEAVLAAEILAAGGEPDPARLLEQRLGHLPEDFSKESGAVFPAEPFAEHLRTWQRSGAPLINLDAFTPLAAFLAKYRLLRKNGRSAGWRFRHDKILGWFLGQ